MALKILLIISAIVMFFSAPVWSAEPSKSHLKVKITRDIGSFTVMHNGKPVVIERNQNQKNTIVKDFALTSRVCPPYCIQPMHLLPGVETIGELEMLKYIKRASKGDPNLLIIDSRTPDWTAKGTIPTSVNIPWTALFRNNPNYEPMEVESILTERFGATVTDGIWNFSNVKDLVFFCNGPWCGQSPTNIKALVSMGYPAHKLHWYRGGMQAWHAFGLTTVTP